MVPNVSNAFAIRAHYKGHERTIELPLSAEMVQKLALEAEFRGMRISCEEGSLWLGAR
jgi:hypothetical protein